MANLDLEQIITTPGAADSAPAGAEKTNSNFAKVEAAIPVNTSDLTNDSGFITNSVSNLANYYTKTQTYTKEEVNSLVGQLVKIQVVSSLPQSGQANTIYLVPSGGSKPDVYDEYVWVNSAWEPIGNTEVDLSNYLQKTGDASDTTITFVSFTMAGTRVNISTGEKLSVAFGKIARWLADLKTVAFTGKYSDLDGRPTSLPANGGNADTVDGKHASDFLPTSAKGAASGVASLDESGRVPAAQLPSYVDDVLEYTTVSAFPAQGEAGKIYVATQTNLTYRWSGTGYVEISPSLALGGTSSTAFPGDRGVTLETKVSGILDGGLKVAKATSADTALEANHASAADNAIHAYYADSASSATNAGDAIRAQQAVKAEQDADGNKIADTYLKRIGGVMTGTLVQKKGNCSIHTDVASYRMPDNHTGWVRIDFGLLGAELLGVIDLIVYGKGGISIDFSGYTYVSSSNPTANNWYAPKYGIRGSLDAPMPTVRFAKDNTTGRRYIMIGGDGFAWGPYGFISLSKIVLGSLGNTTGDLSVSIEAVSGNYADLGLTNASVSNPSVSIEVERARQDGNGNDIPSTYATKEELPDVYVDTVPSNPKDGDILITTTD